MIWRDICTSVCLHRLLGDIKDLPQLLLLQTDRHLVKVLRDLIVGIISLGPAGCSVGGPPSTIDYEISMACGD